MAIERQVNGESKNEMIPIIDYWTKAARSKLVKPTAQGLRGRKQCEPI